MEKIQGEYSVCKYSDTPDMSGLKGTFYFTAATDNEFCLVCLTSLVPNGFIACESGWKLMRIAGQLDFSLIGILGKISSQLALAEVPVFALSTFDTDYIAVKEDKFVTAVSALEEGGMVFIN
ncbi:MAG: ACT domain-containing protein [Clostridia bacterium]|nr:ACT domain-containing protein [Clostridia bacterium]